MLQFFNYSICMVLIITGVVGCSLETPRNYLGGEKVLTSIAIFYTILSVYLLTYAVYNYKSNFCMYMTVFLLKSTVALISAYGLYQATSRWRTKVENVTETSLYLSVIYLLGKTHPFDEFGRRVITDMAIIPVFASLVIGVFTAFVIIRLGKANIPFFFDRFDVLRINFMVVALVGLCCFGNGVAFISCFLITALSIYALLRIFKMSKFVVI